jgi:hypothetical protein
MLETYWNDVKHWAAHPYNEDGNLFDWVLFVGLWVIATLLWVRVIRRLVD